MPGRDVLLAELGVSGKTVELALVQLEKEGILISQGTGKRRQIVPLKKAATQTLRVAILNYDPSGDDEPMTISLLQRLATRGHNIFIAEKTLIELGKEPKRVASFVAKTKADAWIVLAANKEVLQWFASQPIPTLAIYGWSVGVPIAAAKVEYEAPLVELVRSLIEAGHRRIVFLANRGQNEGTPGSLWQKVFHEMQNHGIQTGPYNLPAWEDTADGFHELLDSLFRLTPPTALVVEEMPHLFAVQQFCAERGIRVPRDLSLVCLNPSPDLFYCKPAVTHFWWDRESLVKRIVRWVDNVASGKNDRHHTITKVELVEGGTIGPAPK